ncbi:electron transfer flavoprotein subunit beta/FixA family protein [Trueperella pecoris]|uniref:electron transfer flavoprotein subunit beta/FixA family protein n=1 Tax=Trueperella pecoris TaxID=2733571 RepID=UPI00186B9C4A|nr:electron transfer flavoprotein beta subunit/FixA family protein [Trueperella pecoris]QOQ38469.1 electron transfer flavoprotein beta subunit/FixA family protein [Trueperella pecoris]
MSVIVAYKYAGNPQDAKVNPDGVVDWSRVKKSVSEYDPVAIELAKKLAAEGAGEVVGISVGGQDVASSLAKKNALSKGLDRALVVADNETQGWSNTQTARALAELVRKVDDVQVVFAGDASVDEGAGVMGPLLAGALGWPCLLDVVSVQIADGTLTIRQRTESSTRTVEATGPLVLGVATDAVEVKAASMKEILAAGKKPLDTVALADIATTEVRRNVCSVSQPELRTRKKKVFEGENAAAELVEALKADGIL